MGSIAESQLPGWTSAQVRARRLGLHRLSNRPAGARIADVVSAMSGAHAQIISAAELSIGLRMDGISRTDVRQALWTDRTLIKTYGPRGTVHLLPAVDLPMWIGALSAVPAGPSLPAESRLTSAQSDAVVSAIADVLRTSAVALTVDELGDAVIAATGSWSADLVVPAFAGLWPRWRLALASAANAGALCFGPQRGRLVSYTSPSRWLPGFQPADATSSLRTLVHRYLASYGPATPDYFAKWLAAPRRWAAELFESMTGELTPVEAFGSTAWLSNDDATVPSQRPTGVRLLPYFDAYAVGCHPRSELFAGTAATRALSGGQAGTVPVVLVNGLVGGVWHLHRSGDRLNFTVELLRGIGSRQRVELQGEIHRTAQILQGTATVTFGAVSAGHHL